MMWRVMARGIEPAGRYLPEPRASEVISARAEAGLLGAPILPWLTLVDDVIHQAYQHASADDVS